MSFQDVKDLEKGTKIIHHDSGESAVFDGWDDINEDIGYVIDKEVGRFPISADDLDNDYGPIEIED